MCIQQQATVAAVQNKALVGLRCSACIAAATVMVGERVAIATAVVMEIVMVASIVGVSIAAKYFMGCGTKLGDIHAYLYLSVERFELDPFGARGWTRGEKRKQENHNCRPWSHVSFWESRSILPVQREGKQ